MFERPGRLPLFETASERFARIRACAWKAVPPPSPRSRVSTSGLEDPCDLEGARSARGKTSDRAPGADRRRAKTRQPEIGDRAIGAGIPSRRDTMTALSTTSLSPAGEAALETLMSCLPADLSRVAKLREVHAACSAAGVVDARSTAETSAGDDDDGAGDVARLHSLFDAAVRHGASSLVCHYVDEVCGRDDFSSPDGVEAYLRDGEMVAEWAVAATRGAEALLASASASAASNVPSAADAADAADTAAAVFEATQDVLGLLGARPDAAGEPEPLEQHRGAGRAGGPDGAGSDAASMRRKLQMSFDDASRGCAHAAALAWLVREGLGGATTPDRHGGPAAWTGAVRARRAAAAAASAGAPEASDGGAGKGVGPRGVPASMTVRCSWTTCCRARARIPPRTRSRAQRRRRRASSAPARRSPTR